MRKGFIFVVVISIHTWSIMCAQAPEDLQGAFIRTYCELDMHHQDQVIKLLHFSEHIATPVYARGIFHGREFSDSGGAVQEYSYTRLSAGTGQVRLASGAILTLDFVSGRYDESWCEHTYAEFQIERSAGLHSLINVSSRGVVEPATPLICGFVVADNKQSVLIRAVGPGLAGLGVSSYIADPSLTLFRKGAFVMENDDWGNGGQWTAESISRIGSLLGAFPLANGSSDAVILATLDAGVHTVHASAHGGSKGEVLIEVYVVPFSL